MNEVSTEDITRQLLRFHFGFKSENFRIEDVQRLRDFLHIVDFPFLATTKAICKECYNLDLAGWTGNDLMRFLVLLSDDIKIRRYYDK